MFSNNAALLSRQHCLFDSVHGELRLTDLASTNGTFVNGHELAAKSVVLHKDVPNGVRGLLRRVGKYAIIEVFSKKQRLLLEG